jgi:glutamate synthase (NADPH/NADH) large chain
MCVGMGADAVVPYLIFEATLSEPNLTLEDQTARMKNMLKALRTGIEKCTSTMGIHESRGYGRLFASIGLSNGLALTLGASNYAGSDQGGLTWENWMRIFNVKPAIKARARRPFVNHFYLKIWKMLANSARAKPIGERMKNTWKILRNQPDDPQYPRFSLRPKFVD